MTSRSALRGAIKSVGHRSVVGTLRCDVPARVQRAERMLDGSRTKVRIAPLNASRTAQRAVPTNPAPDTFNHTLLYTGFVPCPLKRYLLTRSRLHLVLCH